MIRIQLKSFAPDGCTKNEGLRGKVDARLILHARRLSAKINGASPNRLKLDY